MLSALGVNIDSDIPTVERCLAEANICFLFAQKHHGAMKHVGPVRAELGTRTIFNLLGPLSNPAGTKRQIIGVFDEQWIEPMAQVLRNLGAERVWVVHGSDGLDEITTTGPTAVAELKDGYITTFTVNPSDAGLPIADPAALRGGDPAENAEAIQALLDGQESAYRDIVVLNSAAALIVAEKADSLLAGAEQAAAAIDSGAAKNTLDALIRVSNGQ